MPIGFVIGQTAFVVLMVAAAFTLRYQLCEEGLCVIMFGVVVRRIPYQNIESVRRGWAFWNEHWNRISFDPCITLRLKRGLVRNFVINPPKTDDFIAQLQARIR